MDLIVNDLQYAWGDVQVAMTGNANPITGVTEISYDKDKVIEEIYARGNDPVATGRGKNKYSGKIKLLQSEVERMLASLPAGKDLTDATVTITVSYANDTTLTTDQIFNASFSKLTKGMKSGDTHQVIELPFTATKIKYNV